MGRTRLKPTFNAELKVAIMRSGETQRGIAFAVGIPEMRMSEIVHGHRAATPAQQKAIAKALRKPVADLFPATDEAVAS